jgi:hypothetical protein
MITFNNWAEQRIILGPVLEQKLVTELIFETVLSKKNNPKISNYVFDQCFFENKWQLSWRENSNTFAEFCYECLKTHIFYNYSDLENFKFYRSVDVFYRASVTNEIPLNKSIWIQDMIDAAKVSTHNKSKLFLSNIIRYQEKEKIIYDIESLL